MFCPLSGRLLAAALLTVSTPLSALASEGENPYASMSLEELLQLRIESATKTDITYLDAPQAVTIVTRSDIERTPATNLPELLRSVVGANVVRLHSSQNVLGTRGSSAFSPSKILILVDGQPIDPTLFSTTWWELVPLSLGDIDRIEVIRSPGTVYGANAQNGVLNIITRKAETGRMQVTAHWKVGEQDLSTAYVGLSRARGRVSYRISAETLTEDAFAADRRLEIVPGKLSPAGEQTFSAGGNHLDFRNFASSLEVRLDGGTLDAFLGVKEIGHARGRVPDRLCFVGVEGDSTFAKARYRFETGAVKHTVSLSGDQIDFEFVRNDDGGSLAPAGMSVRKVTLGYESSLSLTKAHRLLIGTDYSSQGASNESGQPFILGSVEGEGIFGVHLQDEWSLSRRDRVYLGARFSNHYVSGSHLAPMVAWVRRLGEHTSLRLASFTSYRDPNIFEHSIDYDQHTGSSSKLTRIVSNPGLESERTTSYEIGFRVQPRERLFFSADLFVNEVSNGVEWRLDGTDQAPELRPRYRSENSLDQTISGVETAFRYRLSRRWGLETNLTLNEVENRSSIAEYRGEGDRGVNGVGEGRYGERYVPPVIANVIVDFDYERVKGRLHLQHTGAHTWQWPSWKASTGLESLSLKPVPSYSLVNASLNFPIGEHFSVSLEGWNLFNELHTEWRGDKSIFGRMVWGKLGVRF